MIKNKKTLQNIVMILCFVYAGISALLLIYQVYFMIQRGIAPHVNRLPNVSFNRLPNVSFNESIPRGVRGFRGISTYSPIILITSFLGMIISSFAGFTIMSLLKKKEKKEIKSSVMNAMLMPEEKLVIKILERHDGELTQSELVKQSKLTKLKISRVIKRLESLKVVSKYPYGVTNKIKLEKKIDEEEEGK